jgi:hypothetical protein
MLLRKHNFYFFAIVSVCLVICNDLSGQKPDIIKVGVFQTDVTPPIGSPVAYAKTRSIRDPLSARGIVLFINKDQPIVLCAVDWIGIANESQDVWKKKLADAAHTSTDRVSVHSLHQHDGVWCDFTMEKVLKQYDFQDPPFDHTFLTKAIQNVADSVAVAYSNALPVTHIGFGKAKVERVASNRRVLGADGKVAHIRWSSGNDSATVAAPEGLVDPYLKCVSFWNNDKAITAITFYPTHPQSYYGQGDVSCDFVGIARNRRQIALDGLPLSHFNGAGGNITTGKYNDGTEASRQALARKLETAMQAAWEQTQKTPVTKNVEWRNTTIRLPLGNNIVEEKLRATLSDNNASRAEKISAAEKLAWYIRSKQGVSINISSVRLGMVWLLNLPGELFVEYQLAAQKMKPGEEVCTAAYEDYGPGYIGTAVSYSQGGYETTDLNSGVSPEAEAVIMKGIRKVLK